MSRGFSARMLKETEDEKWIKYKYACAHASNANYYEAIETFDGAILIERECFEENSYKSKKNQADTKKLTKRMYPLMRVTSLHIFAKDVFV